MLRAGLFSLVVVILFSLCKTKKPEAVNTRPPMADNNLTLGTVSHKYGTCGTVVIIKAAGPGVILVPYPALDKSFDIDGLSIKFTYRKLRIPQREGCENSVMAELKDVTKSN
ncbi:MAG TPA: hypothetical protein VN026_13820 [Bacteroidia bacterium]|jgi:hypothetical protein|nr:hypothetical protein [Bacteroidia bacterium]